MEFNVAKCKVMHVGPRNPGHGYQMAGKDLEVTTEEKDIGVTVTSYLRPTQQCRRAARTARGVLSQIQGQENVHQTLRPVCQPTRGICGPSLGAVDGRGQTSAGASATTGGENDFRFKRTDI